MTKLIVIALFVLGCGATQDGPGGAGGDCVDDDCVCPAGQACAHTCEAGAPECHVECESASSCRVDCGGADECHVTCPPTGCTVTRCTAPDCQVTCGLTQAATYSGSTASCP